MFDWLFSRQLVCSLLKLNGCWIAGQPVIATTGVIVGHPSSLMRDVSAYQGIPFARPPVGELRWAAPAPLERSSRIINATNFSHSCAESASAPLRRSPGTPKNIGAAENEMSEDCLSLNIWTKPQTGERKKAVMIWIYGGGFVLGSSANAVYDGTHLAQEQDVVVVSINYRVSALGFPGVPLPSTNLGLLDQRMAVEWLRDNIAKFGGDPKRMVLFGQSAGGVSVDFYAYTYHYDPIVHGLIPQSGLAAAIDDLSPEPNVRSWSELSMKLGCGMLNERNATSSLPCMRSKPLEAVLNATELKPPAQTVGIWGPKYDNITVFRDWIARGRKGDFIKIPILVGNTNGEAATSGQQPESQVSRSYNCRPAAAAKLRVALKVPVWRYLYSATFPNLSLGERFNGIRGAWHGSEIGLIFGNTENRGLQADTANERELGKTIRTAWASFAKDPWRGLDALHWPQYSNPSKAYSIRL